MSEDELRDIGAHLVTLLATSRAMGHGSPAQTVMYAAGDSPAAQLVLDAFAICIPAGNVDADHRIDRYLAEHDVAAKIAAAVER